jgi:P-type Cu+ transporter
MKKQITINGMHCAGCVNSVEKAIERVEGVKSVSVQLTTEKASIDFEGEFPAEAVKDAIENAGYKIEEPAAVNDLTFDIDGMHCTGCSAAVEKAASGLEGVTDVNVNLAAGKAYIRFDPQIVQPDTIADRIENAGYTVVFQKKKTIN